MQKTTTTVYSLTEADVLDAITMYMLNKIDRHVKSENIKIMGRYSDEAGISECTIEVYE